MIQFCQGLKEKDFSVKSESISRKRKGKREYLNDTGTKRMMREIELCFVSNVNIPLIRHGKRQKIETLIIEEAQLLALYLRDEKKVWVPRIIYF